MRRRIALGLVVAAVMLPLAVGGAKAPPEALTAEQSGKVAAGLRAKGWSESKETTPNRGLLELRPSAFVKKSPEAARALRSRAFGGESLQRLRKLVQSEIDPAMRSLAFEALADSPDPRAQPILLELYPSASEANRLRILRRIDPGSADPAGFDLLLRETKSGSSTQIRKAARRRLLGLKLQEKSGVGLARERLRTLPSDLLEGLRRKPLPLLRAALKKEPEEAEKLVCDPEPSQTNALGPVRRGERLKDVVVNAPEQPSTVEPRIDERGRTILPKTKPEIDPEKLRSTRKVVPVKGEIDPAKPFHTFVRVGGAGDGELDGKFIEPTDAQIAKPGTYRQVVIFPTGYEPEEFDKFHADARRVICDMAHLPENVFTRDHRAHIVYLIRWLPGGDIDTSGPSDANFEAALFDHPIRGGKGITMDNREAIDAVAEFKQKVRPIDPIGVMVIFDVDDEVTANASPPTFLRRKDFGIARITREDIYDDTSYHDRKWGEYVPMHELAHGALNFLDEYIEASFRDFPADVLDFLTSPLLLDGTWAGFRDSWEKLIGNYDIRVTEILADNGSSNISTRRSPATVESDSSPYSLYDFARDGGMFLSNGTTHADGNNVMNNDRIARGDDKKPDGDRFDWNHSAAQRHVVAQVFDPENKARRPNDRLRNAGPLHEWLPQIGDEVRLLLQDGDKNHRWHPTKKYRVRVGWWELDLSDCPAKTCIPGDGFDAADCALTLGVSALDLEVPEKCDPTNEDNWVWETMTNDFTPSVRNIDLGKLIVGDVLGFVQHWAVEGGLQEISLTEGQPINLAAMTLEDLVERSLPAVEWPTPYQDVKVDLSLGHYWWKFRTYNGTHWSGWTEYSPVTVVGP